MSESIPSHIGPFTILRVLGRGGMGLVCEGGDPESGRHVAIKTILAHHASEPSIRKRFEAEMDAMIRLHHPNIVRILGCGTAADGDLFYVMEMIDGMDLEHAVPRGKPILWMTAVKLVLEICKGLKAAHDRGIIHRDLKPSNVLCTPDGRVLLTDFGIARLFGSENETVSGAILGTAEYMSPEQARGERLDQRTDIYAVGGILYRLIAGRPPLVGRNVTELLHKQRNTVPDPLSTYAVALPSELDRLVSSALEKDRTRRPASALSLARRLTEILEQYGQLDFPPLRLPMPSGPRSPAPPSDGVTCMRGPEPNTPRNAPPAPDGSDGTLQAPGGRGVNAFSDLSPTFATGDSDRSLDQTLPSGNTPALYHFEIPSGAEMFPITDSGSDSSDPDNGGSDAHRGAAMTRPSGADTGTMAFQLHEAVRAIQPEQVATFGAKMAQDGHATQPAPAADRPVTPQRSISTSRGTGAAGSETGAGGDEYRAIRDAERDRLTLADAGADAIPVWKMPQTWAIVGLLLALLGGGAWMMRPITADRLATQLDEIVANAPDGGVALRAEEPIRRFLAEFPGDPRCDEWRKYLDEIELSRLERQLEWRTRQASRRGEPATPIQLEYLRAVTLAREEPARGAARFESLLRIYADRENNENDDGKCYTLIKRQFEKYTELAARQETIERAELERVLAEILELSTSDPGESRERMISVSEIYADRPWAEKSIRETNEKLK